MSIALQTSYSANLKYIDRTQSSSTTQKTSAPSSGTTARAANLQSLEDALGPENFKQLQGLRARKQALMGQLPNLQSRFEQAEKGFGSNLKSDINDIVNIGKSVFRTASMLKQIESQISELLGDVDPSSVTGVAEGKGNTRFDASTLANDRQFSSDFAEFTQKLYNAYEATKDAAQQSQDREALRSPAMKLADKHGRKLINFVNHYENRFSSASAQTSTLSLLA